MINPQEIDPKKLSMMTVAVFEPTDPRKRVQKFSHFNYTFIYPNVPNVSIACDVADKKLNAMKKQGIGYTQAKWFLYAELTA